MPGSSSTCFGLRVLEQSNLDSSAQEGNLRTFLRILLANRRILVHRSNHLAHSLGPWLLLNPSMSPVRSKASQLEIYRRVEHYVEMISTAPIYGNVHCLRAGRLPGDATDSIILLTEARLYASCFFRHISLIAANHSI